MSFRFQPSNLSFSSSSYGDAGGAGSGVQYYAPLRQMGAANATDNKKEVQKGSAAYNAIQSQIAYYYGPMPAMGSASFRDVYGLTPNALPRQRTGSQFVPSAYRDGYIYRQFSDGRIFIQAEPTKAPVRATGATVRTSSSDTPSQTQIPTRTTAAAPAEPALPSTEIDEAQGEASTGPDWKKYALIGIPALLFVGVAAYMVLGGSQDKASPAAMANPRKKKKKASKKVATKRKSTRKVKAKTKAKAKSKIKAKSKTKAKAKVKSKAKKHAKAKTSKTKAKKSRKSA
jgi:hypothetical protein